jgi:hypothetical protein
MNLNHKIPISLLDVLKSGRFDYLKIGMSKDEVMSVFPEPEDFNGKSLAKATIWRYGNFELHFTSKNVLVGVFNDYVGSFNGGKYLEIDAWILNNTEECKLLSIQQQLNEEGIDYEKITTTFGQIELKITKTSVHLIFDKPDEQNKNPLMSEDYQLFTFMLK